MKKIICVLLIMGYGITAFTQNEEKQHDGFYMSACLGPVFGKITDKYNSSTMTMNGTGFELDLKIGASVTKDLILHGTLITKSMPGPKVNNEGSVTTMSDEISVNELMYGAGLTYYFMPVNFFVSGSAGIGKFTVSNSTNDTKSKTHSGFSFQLIAGKEWWISKKWGLGAGITYSKTHLTNKVNETEEKLDSNRFSIMLSVTFD